MSAGFPVRPLRQAFGPEPRNRTPVRNAEFEMDGETVGRLMMHQLAGTGLMVPLARLVILTASTPAITLVERYEAWNPRGLVTSPHGAPALARAAAGDFTITYAAQIPDWSEAAQPLVFQGGVASFVADDTNVYTARVIPTTPASSVVRVRGWQWTAPDWVAADGRFLVLLW